MAAGDLITTDGQIELRATLMGADTDFVIHRTRGGIRGLRSSEMKAALTDYSHADGSFIGEVWQASRVITVALLIKGSTVGACSDNVDAMYSLWSTPTSDDEPLHVQLPGMGKRYVNGRPFGIIVEEEGIILKHVPALAMFQLGTDLTLHDAV